jgi:hypothetical protein
MPRSKSYHLLPRVGGKATGSDVEAAQHVRPSVGGGPVSLEAWRGRGIDSWLDEISKTLLCRSQSGAFEKLTIDNQARTARFFFEFLLSSSGKGLARRGLAKLTSIDMAAYASWLKEMATAQEWKPSTSRTIYSRTKTLLWEALRSHGDSRDPRHLFQKNPFPGSYGSEETASPLSEREFSALASALKKALADHHHQRRPLTGASLPTARLLAVAMRTGMNRMPLIELTQSCLSEGLLPGTKLLQAKKHRGRTVQVKALRGGEAVVEQSVVPMDAVAIIQDAIADARALRSEAVPYVQDLLWLYRKAARVELLRYGTFDWALRSLVRRWGVVGDDGKPLLVNASRLRSTFASMAWRVTDGDPIAVAGLLGNSPRIADTHYLRVTHEDLANAAGFMSAGLVEMMTPSGRRAVAAKGAAGFDPVLCSPTPSGRCSHNRSSSDAFRSDQQTCTDFHRCLSCRSFVVVGEEEDLWRLFSYQAYLRAEVEQLAASSLASDLIAWCQDAITFIDAFVQKHFDKATVSAAVGRANETMHPFWAFECQKSNLRRGAEL